MDLLRRLRQRVPVEGRPYKSDATRPINPDGPAAADEIERLTDELRWNNEENEKLLADIADRKAKKAAAMKRWREKRRNGNG